MKDETAGSICFYTKELCELAKLNKGDKDLKEPGRYNNMFLWKNVYGSPMDQKGSKSKTAMNENPEMASTWKGRVLFQVSAEKEDKPKAKTNDVDVADLAAAEEAMISKEYAIIA